MSAGTNYAGDDNGKFLANNPDDTNPMQELINKEKLPEDYETPFSPPNGVQDRLGNTHPHTDSGKSQQEQYDAGIEAASGGDLSGEAADEKAGGRTNKD